MLIKLAGVALTLMTSVLVVPAAADPIASPSPAPPSCRQNMSTGECELNLGSSKPVPGKTKPGAKPVGGSGCVFEGQTIPCRTVEGFYDAATGCYLTQQERPSSLVNSASDYPPGTKFYSCWVILGVVEGRPVGEERFESVAREPGEPAVVVDPRVVARQVVESMVFVAPQLGLSPSVQSATGEGIVNVPIWMWVTDPGVSTTGPLTKTATLSGVTIEATGTVDRIEWSMGGGDVVTCKGPGTPFTRANAEGKSLKEIPASPTCGHKYRKTSRCEKSGQFQVTATAYWNVHWTGGGLEGDIPLNFSRSTPLRVTDLRPVLVAPEGGEATTQPQPRPCPQ